MKLPRAKKSQVSRQRRRTLDNSTPPAFSYHAQRAERPDTPARQQTSLADKRHRLLSLRFWVKRSGFLVAVLVSLICLISILSLSNQPRIVLLNKSSDGYAFHDTPAYQAAAAKHLASSFWNKNKITINTGAASSALRQQFPELANVTVTLPLIGHRPIYYLHANEPAFILQTANGTYVLDSSGIALIAKDTAPAAVTARLPVVADQTGTQVTLGKQIVSGAEASFIQTVTKTLANKQVIITSIVLPAGAVQELDVRVDGHPYTIKFNMHDTSTARQQVGTYLATVNNLAGQQLIPSQYIDVRVPGRAYYQ